MTNQQLDNFVNYVYDYYGENGFFNTFKRFDSVTKEEIQRVAIQLCQTSSWGDGDTMDREMTRDIMLVARGVTDVEYAKGLRKYGFLTEELV